MQGMHPGVFLKELRNQRDIPGEFVSDLLGIPEPDLESFEAGTRSLDFRWVETLECIFDVPEAFWLHLQQSFDKKTKKFYSS